jgi:hypothetical protein
LTFEDCSTAADATIAAAALALAAAALAAAPAPTPVLSAEHVAAVSADRSSAQC